MSDPSSESNAPQGNANGESRDQLIESIYRIALEPQTYDSFMGHWDSYITERVSELHSLMATDDSRAQASHNPEIETHFQIAAQLLEQMGRPDLDSKDVQTGTQKNPQLLVDAQGRIVWSSTAAVQAFDLPINATTAQLPLNPAQLDALDNMVQAVLTAEPADRHAPLLLNMATKDAGELLYMVARVLPETHGSDVILITKITPDWPDGMPALLRDGFALSKSEIDICELIADGKNPAEIADARSSALATVRTQVKKIMGKTHCGSQGELVRLLHSVMRVADQQESDPKGIWTSADRVTQIMLPDRAMPIEHYGDPDGFPVVFFHGMLDGNAMTRAFQAELQRHNLRLICPVRPYFGNAAGREGSPDTAPKQFADDIRMMIDQLALKNPVFLAHMAGSVYAAAAAAALPSGTLRGILCVSGGVPMTSIKQFSTMSRRQRLVAYTARYTPKILPFVIRAGINQMDNGGERTFLHSLYENAPDDLPLINDPEIRDLVLGGYRFTTRQGHRAFEIDSHNVVRDWTETFEQSDVPFNLLHGRSDPVVSAASAEAFAARHSNRVSLEVLEDSGQLILYQHHKKIVATLCALRDRGHATR